MEETTSDVLREIAGRGAAEARAVRLMRIAQRMKLLGIPQPNALKAVLKRLRHETGLPLDTSLL
jgi:hypothetical protein